VIDLHSHILPGLDDGAKTLDDSRAMAALAEAEGIAAIAATPHVRGDFPTTPEQMEERVGTLRVDFAQRGLHVDVLHGAELGVDVVPTLSRHDVRRFSIAQGGRYLLLEFPRFGWPLGLGRVVSDLGSDGVTAVLAHPERNADVQREPDRLRTLVDEGALVQLAAASLDGRLGRPVRAAALGLFDLRLAHLLASDAHAPGLREPGLAAAALAVGDEGLARYLTVEAPTAVVSGEDVPRAPARGRRRRRFVLL
jgi:protein-tyrosine phosphatase